MFVRAIAVAAGLAALLFAGSAALADPAHAGSMDRPRLGVVIVELTPELRRHFGAPGGHGVLVARVVPGSAAERAGVGVGDVVVEVGGRPVASAGEILSALGRTPGGAQVEVVVVRDRRELVVAAEIEAVTRPERTRLHIGPSAPYRLERWSEPRQPREPAAAAPLAPAPAPSAAPDPLGDKLEIVIDRLRALERRLDRIDPAR